MKQLLLHVGIGKTATSTIQKDLINNAGMLAAQGVAFPVVERSNRRFDGNMSAIATTLFSDRALLLEENIADGCDTEERLAQRRKDYAAQLDEQIDASPHSVFLMSCEAITNYDPVTFERLMNWLDQRFSRIDAIACLRHPVELLASDIQQRVKVGFVVEDVLEGEPIIRYDSLLGRLLDRCETLTCYDFADAIERGVTARFLEACTISGDSFVYDSVRSNESLSQIATELMSMLNARRPLKVEGAWGHGRFLEDRDFYFGVPGPPFRVSSEDLDRQAEAIATQVEWIRELFGIKLRRTSDGDLHARRRLDKHEAAYLALSVSDLMLDLRALRREHEASLQLIEELHLENALLARRCEELAEMPPYRLQSLVQQAREAVQRRLR